MTEDVRNRLDDELSWQDRAPVDAMVARAVTHGRHVRRVRRAGAQAGTAAVVGLTVVAVAFGSQLGGTSSRQSAGAGASTLVVPKPTAVATVAAKPTLKPTVTAQVTQQKTDAKPAPGGVPAVHSTTVRPRRLQRTLAPTPPGVRATTRGQLQLLTEQLGTLGTTSHAGVASDGTMDVELYLTTAEGTGMVRPPSTTATRRASAPRTIPPTGSTQTARRTRPATSSSRGARREQPHPAPERDGRHPDGAVVGFDLATCLAWDGKQRNLPGPQAITAAQAAAFGADPRWDMSMSPQLVAAGASNFPSPYSFS